MGTQEGPSAGWAKRIPCGALGKTAAREAGNVAQSARLLNYNSSSAQGGGGGAALRVVMPGGFMLDASYNTDEANIGRGDMRINQGTAGLGYRGINWYAEAMFTGAGDIGGINRLQIQSQLFTRSRLAVKRVGLWQFGQQ